jgi:hypothetical protein
MLPAGAPGLLCLYADFRPGQLDTLVYLCNAGLEVLSEVTVVIDNTSMFSFYQSEPAKRWASVDATQQIRWNVVPPGTCVLINTLSHYIWDEVNRYSLTFTDAAGQRRTAQTHDLALNACRLAQDPDNVWVAFDAAGPSGQAGREAIIARAE